MKKIMCSIGLVVILIFANAPKAHAQSAEITQLLLDVEKLSELKKILREMYQGYRILTKGYNTIKDISQGNFSMHQAFLGALLAVNPQIAKYQRVSDIIQDETQIIKEYKESFAQFKRSSLFSAGELDFIQGAYINVMDASIKVLNELAFIITANKLRMSDMERIQGIDRLYADIHSQVEFSHNLTNKVTLLGMEKAQEQNNITALKILHGIK